MITLTVARGWPIVALRARRLPALGGVHRAAAAAEEARPRRADRARGVGPAHGRRHLLRGDRHDPGRGDPRVAAVRVALHDGADGQAHRQDPVGRARRHAHAAGDPRRGARPARVTQGMFVVFYASIVALVIARVLPVASVLVLLSLPLLLEGVGGVLAARSPRSRRSRTRCGRSGSRRCRSW